jgi:hypothetical protein
MSYSLNKEILRTELDICVGRVDSVREPLYSEDCKRRRIKAPTELQ